MTRVTIRHGAVLKCQGTVSTTDPDTGRTTTIRCPVQFPSYSVVRMIRKQAEIAGWGRVPTWHITADRGDGKQLGDACPEHYEIAKLNAQRTQELLRTQRDAEKAERKAARDAEKAERDRLKAEKVAKWAAQKEEWARRRVDKAERKQDRSQRLALKSAAAAFKANGAATKVKRKAETTVRNKRARSGKESKAQKKASSDRDTRIAGARSLVEGTPRETTWETT